MFYKKKLYLILTFFGIFHWFCFYYVSDYYSYNNLNPESQISFENYNKNYTSNISIKTLKEKFYKSDKELLKQFFHEKGFKLNKIFTFNNFIENDWYKEIAYLKVISDSIRNKFIPFHVDGLNEIVHASNKFLGSPIYTLSPQILLLNFISVNSFILLNLFLMFSIGLLGLFFISKEFKLSLLPILFLYIFFNFNGYFISKYSYYGASQLGYFILPFVFLGLIKISNVFNYKKEIAWSIFLGMSLSFLLLQGSLHLYIETLTLILFWAIFNLKKWRLSLTIIFVNFSTSFFRLLPAFLSYGGEANPHASLDGFGGYGNLSIFLESLISVKTHFDIPGFWHELSVFISLPFFIMILLFGLFCYLFDRYNFNKSVWKGMVFPVLLIFIISFHKFKFIILPNFIPLFNAESLTTRYIIIPILFLAIVAAINLNNYIKTNSSKSKNFLFGFMILSSFLLLMNYSRNWRNNLYYSELKWAESLNLKGWHFVSDDIILTVSNNYNDNIYIYSIYLSFLISLFSYTLFIYLFIKLKRG